MSERADVSAAEHFSAANFPAASFPAGRSGKQRDELSANGCCAPSAQRSVEVGATSPEGPGLPELVRTSDPSASSDAMRTVALSGGVFAMGAADERAYAEDGEGPVREIKVSPFRISPTTVSNREFARFVEDTGYRTEAQQYGWSFVFAGLLPDDFPPTRGVANAPWWRAVEGADWRHPEGPQSTVEQRGTHPVVHVTHTDARAFCAWAGARLPTEAEWEFAARGGLYGRAFPWGDELEPGGAHRMNVWQGTFPGENTAADGWYGTCPVDAFPANGHGLYNMTGNVWEWCQDWFHTTFHTRDVRTDPRGPSSGSRRCARGGSYLCHESHCRRYRVSGRQGVTPDSSLGNVGFRCVIDSTG